MTKYIYISDFLSKKLKENNVELIKNYFLEIEDTKNLKLIELEANKTLNNLPNLKFNDDEVNTFLDEIRENEEAIEIFSNKILKKDLSDFIRKPNSVDELMIFTISSTLSDIYEENKEDLIVEDISGFEPIYQKKRCDLIISREFLNKYFIMIKRVVLFEELSFVKDFETRTDSLTKNELKEAKRAYDSILRLIEEFKISLMDLSLDFPEMRRKFIRVHKETPKSKPILNLSKEVEANNQKIIEELNKIAENARKRKDFILKELEEKYIDWNKIKKKFIEQKILRLS